MNTKQIIIGVILLTSLAVNGILIHERLEQKFYQKGIQDGVKRMGDQIIGEVQKNQAITVKMPDGKQVMLGTVEAIKKQLIAQAQRLQPTPKPKEPPIDAMQGTIDQPKEVNQP